jgi:hypothetical protein
MPECAEGFKMARPKSVSPVVVSASFTYDPASVDAYNLAQITLTSSTDQAIGMLQKDFPVTLWANSLEAGLVISNARCDAFGVLKFTLYNATGTAIDPASQTFNLVQR